MVSRSLLAHFADVPDARSTCARRHPLINILFIALCATLVGAEDFVAMERFGHAKSAWLAPFLDLRTGIPSHDTFGRVFAHLDPDAFTGCFIAWVEAIRTQVSQQVVALDGKTLRRSFDTASGRGAIPMVSAWAQKNRLVLGQVKVDAKSNEITAIPTLLEMLDLHGCIVTMDAMGCQSVYGNIANGRGEYGITQVATLASRDCLCLFSLHGCSLV